jgi:poly(glycerol-phosphate) alpha-glucosyltransferase
MKIQFVTASLSRAAGGLFESVRRLAQATAGAGYDVEVLGVEDVHSEADLAAWQPLCVHLFSRYGPERFSFAPMLLRGIQSGGANLVMLHGLWRYTSIATHRWHQYTGLPYIVHPHGMLDDWALRNARWKKRLASFCYEAAHLRDATCLRALCEAEAVAIRRYGLTNPIAIIPNGVEVPEEGTTGPRDHGLRDNGTMGRQITERRSMGPRMLLFLGRIHPKKGLVHLLKAWKQVRADDWVLAIAGWDDGGHLADLKQLCDELNLRWEEEGRGEREERCKPNIAVLSSLSSLPSSVCFLGPQFNQAKSACYHACDAFILPSFSEGLPMAVLEAWSYGKPVLMTEHCHLPAGFAAGAAMRISTDPHELAHALIELVRMSDAELADMGNRGLDLVKTRFNWQTTGALTRTVCDWVAAGGPRPECVEV